MKLHCDSIELLQGQPWGKIYPPRSLPYNPTTDGRSIALSIFRKYLASLRFHLPAGDIVSATNPGQTRELQICEDAIFIEAADSVDIARLPAIVLIPGEGIYDSIGLTNYIDEKTVDVFGVGTAIQSQSEYTETFTLQVWAPTKPVRRALVAGIETSLVPTEDMYGIRFKMPGYWNEMVCFTLKSRTNIDDSLAQTGKLRVNFGIEMRYNVVRLVALNGAQTIIVTEVD